jgi:hypothetical protein
MKERKEEKKKERKKERKKEDTRINFRQDKGTQTGTKKKNIIKKKDRRGKKGDNVHSFIA